MPADKTCFTSVRTKTCASTWGWATLCLSQAVSQIVTCQLCVVSTPDEPERRAPARLVESYLVRAGRELGRPSAAHAPNARPDLEVEATGVLVVYLYWELSIPARDLGPGRSLPPRAWAGRLSKRN